MAKSRTKAFEHSPLRSPTPVRTLEAHQLYPSQAYDMGGEGVSFVSELDELDPIYVKTKELLASGYAGVIFSGPPGTSKSWYAFQIAYKLTDQKPGLVRFIQFHPSYQYEDFVEGYVPKVEGGFVLKAKHLLEMCQVASTNKNDRCILVIDELSRCDPGRVFGEALTYIEMTKRGQSFHLASGTVLSIPPNLIILATMNPLDRGVDEVDAALERRFAKIAMDPEPSILRKWLSSSGMNAELQKQVEGLFEQLRSHSNPYCRIGHAYFHSVKDLASLKRLWDHQLKFQLEKAFKLYPEEFETIRMAWQSVLSPAPSSDESAKEASYAKTTSVSEQK